MEKQALCEAQKALDRYGADHFPKLDLARLKIQTMEPWKRLLLAFLGLASCLGAYGALVADIIGNPSTTELTQIKYIR